MALALTNSPALEKEYGSEEPFDVTLFDSRSNLDLTAGAGIQLNGGLAVLGEINPEVQKAVMKAGLPQTGVRSRCKPWNPENQFDTLLELSLKDTVEKAGGKIADSLIKHGELLWVAIMRGALQEALLNALPHAKQVQFGKDLVSINSSSDRGAECHFADGTKAGPFDLIVGCDGIKSACKEYIETGRISADASKREGAAAAVYSGIRIRYAIKDGSSKEEQEKTARLSQYFGNGAYALDGTYGAGPDRPNTKCAFIVFLDDNYICPFKKKEKAESKTQVRENADWAQDVRSSVDVARETMIRQTKSCGVPDGDIGPTIGSADRFFELGVYFHNPFSLAGWSKEIPDSEGAYTVLCGDAAHALPPFLGQGSNQAVQDAYCMAKKIHEYNAQVRRGEEEANLKVLLKDYETTRWPGAFQIFWKSAFLGYLETGGTNGLYSKFRDVFFKTMGIIGVAQRVLLSAAMPKV